MKSLILLMSLGERFNAQLHYYTSDWKSLLMIIFIGGVAGMLAEFLVGSKSMPMLITIIIGIIGSWLGNLLFAEYLNFPINELFNILIRATAGAMILVIIISIFFRLRSRDKSNYRA